MLLVFECLVGRRTLRDEQVLGSFFRSCGKHTSIPDVVAHAKNFFCVFFGGYVDDVRGM